MGAEPRHLPGREAWLLLELVLVMLVLVGCGGAANGRLLQVEEEVAAEGLLLK